VSAWRDELLERLRARRLLAHPRKTQVFPVGNGVPFLGFRVYPRGRRVLRSGIRRFLRRMRRYAVAVGNGSMEPARVGASLTAWFGVVPPRQHERLVTTLLAAVPFHPPGARLPFTWIPDPT
jgi:hypothetical protein